MNLNYENTPKYFAEVRCIEDGEIWTPDTVQSSNDSMWLPIVAILSCIALIALIIASCLSCCGIGGKKCCWYDCYRSKKDNCESVQPTKGAEPEIYQALGEIAEQTGLPPSKTKAYVEVFEQHEIYCKSALFLHTREELDSIARECRMGAGTKALLVKLWMSGQNGQQPDQTHDMQPMSQNPPEVVSTLPPGAPEVPEALPPGIPINKSTKVEQAKLVRAYTRLNLTKDELKGDEESKQKV